MGNVSSLEFWGIVLTECAIKLNCSALDLSLYTLLQVPQSENVGTFEFHLTYQAGAGQASNCESVSCHHSLSQKTRNSSDEAIYFHLIFVQSVLILLFDAFNLVKTMQTEQLSPLCYILPHGYVHLKAYTVCLNLSSLYCARKWGMAFINCSHDFLLWQESESISKYQTSQLCLIIIYAKSFHMLWTKKKKKKM